MKVKALDHLVLTVRDIAATVEFYEKLGLRREEFVAADESRRVALCFGAMKINLHLAGAEFSPRAKAATPGSADFCFLSDDDLSIWLRALPEAGIEIAEGPVPRTGATGPLRSIYLRDPDGNLVEIANRV